MEVVITAAMVLLATGLSVILVNRNLKQESIELLNRKSDESSQLIDSVLGDFYTESNIKMICGRCTIKNHRRYI